MRQALALLVAASLLQGCGRSEEKGPGPAGGSANAPSAIAAAEATRLLAERGLDAKYGLASKPHPSFLQGDFDGDGKDDVAAAVQELASQKSGIAFLLGNGTASVVGAGTEFGNGGDDFEWLDQWERLPQSTSIQPGPSDAEPPKLKGDALFVVAKESASGLIYWDGSGFAWYQMGD